MTLQGRHYTKAFCSRIKAIHANHGTLVVGLFMAHKGIPIGDALALIKGGK